MAATAEQRWTLERWLLVIGTVAAVVGAVAAAAVFWVRTADARDEDRRPAATGTEPPVSSAPASPPASGAGSAAGRDLVSMTPSTGTGSVHADGRDLVVSCPTNVSDDSYRELRYELAAPYTALRSAVSVEVRPRRRVDPDASAAVQAYAVFREGGADRREEAGRAVVVRDAPGGLDLQLQDTRAVVLRVTCTSPDQLVRLGGPQLIR